MTVKFKFFLLSLLLPLYLVASSLEQRAFEAYKSKDYIKSVKLYTQAAKNKNLKAYLMLAIFCEKGIGIKKNKAQAVKFYKYILKSVSQIKKIINRQDYKKIGIAITALKRLSILEGDRKYINLIKKLTIIKGNIDISQTELFSETIGGEDDYLILCPYAEIIPPEDREGIEDFDCSLFEYFPKEMKKFMKLRSLRFKIMKLPLNEGIDKFKVVNKKIKEVIKPMIKYLQQELVGCYNRAVDLNAIRSCDYDYLQKSDPFMFKNRAYNMEQYVLHNILENHKLTTQERANLVDELIKKINSGNYLKKYNNMIQ